MMLRQLQRVDDKLLAIPAEKLAEYLAGPTLIHLQGRREPPLFVSILLHGNETVGWEALQALLGRYRTADGEYDLPRSMSLFFGNVQAAAEGKRRLDGQPDYNRVWPGTEHEECDETRLMREVVDIMSAHGVFASVDVHNNTGLNPHYACVNVLDNRFLNLATQFSRTVVYFIRPRGVQSQAMAELCPAVTLECGKVGQAHGVEHASQYLDACLHMSEIPDHPVAEHDIDLFHTVARVTVPEGIEFGFDTEGPGISFDSDLDHMNFRELPVGTRFGRVSNGIMLPLTVKDELGQDVSERFFDLRDGELVTRLPVMPSMLTRDEKVIRQDCLCYLMERYNSQLTPAGSRLDADA